MFLFARLRKGDSPEERRDGLAQRHFPLFLPCSITNPPRQLLVDENGRFSNFQCGRTIRAYLDQGGDFSPPLLNSPLIGSYFLRLVD